MSRKTQSDNSSMSSLQKQAVLICVICALAALLTAGITLTLLKKGKSAPAEPAVSESQTADDGSDGENLSEHYQINQESAALLPETGDAGEEYLNDTLFLGDSNTVRLYNNGLISLQQFCAKEGIGTQAALSDGIVTFKNDGNHYTIAEAVAKMKPRRVVMTFGTNDTGMEVNEFITHYTTLVQTIQASYPYTDIIVNTVPPIPENHSNYPHMDQAKIDDFNMALLNMCEQLGLKFLNTAEVLKGEDGYGIADYYTNGDIHLKTAGLKAALNYLRTHAYSTEDRRPDTANIPTRTLEYTSNPSSAVQAPSSSEAASSESSAPSESESTSTSSSESSSESKEPAVQYEVRYQVEKSGGGSLSCGSDSGKSLHYTVTDPSKSLTVTAVPAEGHVFVKWSDGETSKTRTDTGFKQNLDVTAVFASLSVKITGEKSLSGNAITFRANVSGKYGSADSIRWYANGVEVKEAAGHSTVTVQITDTSDATYKVHAVVSYNDCSVSSNTLTISVVGSGSSSSSSSSGGSSSSSSSGASSGSTSSSSGSSSSHSSSTSSSSESSSSSHSSSSSSSGSSSSSSSASPSTSSSSASESHSTASSSSSSKSESTSESKAESKAESASSSSHTEASASKEASSESKAE